MVANVLASLTPMPRGYIDDTPEHADRAALMSDWIEICRDYEDTGYSEQLARCGPLS